MSAGTVAIDKTAKKFADMTATEVSLGFGDTLCDFRAPLAQVKIFAEVEPLETVSKTAAELKDEAKALHNKTAGKIAKEERYNGEEGEEETTDTPSPATPTTTEETPTTQTDPDPVTDPDTPVSGTDTPSTEDPNNVDPVVDPDPADPDPEGNKDPEDPEDPVEPTPPEGQDP